MSEKQPDFFKMFQEITKSLPAYTELYFILFVQFRNLYSGANTITCSGLTSPNDGWLREFPTFGPDGAYFAQGNKEGTTGLPTITPKIPPNGTPTPAPT